MYSEEALVRAREAFSHLASIEVGRSGRYRTVRFSKVNPAAATRLVDEFANYALSCLLVTP